MSEFHNKVVLVTGGTSGIGLATVKRFLLEGAIVYATGTRSMNEEAHELSRLHHPRMYFLRADISDPADTNAVVATIATEQGRIDVLVSNAGVAPFTPVDLLSWSGIEDTFRINTLGPLYLVRTCIPHMEPGSRIVVTTSALSHRRLSGCSVYSGTKAALTAIMETLAVELAPKGISVNAVCPGPIDTPIHHSLGLSEKDRLALKESVIKRTPEGRYGDADEVASAILFLSSGRRAGFIRGAELRIDGAWCP